MPPLSHPRQLHLIVAGLLATGAVLAANAIAAPQQPAVFETVAVHAVGGEPAVTYNPSDPANLVVMNKSGTAVSFDHGDSWRYVGPDVADPQVVADRDGRFYATAPSDGSQYDTLGPGVLVQTSTDGGLSWTKPVQVFPHTGWAQADDRPWLAIDPQTGTAYATVARHRVPPGWGQTPSSYVFLPTTSTPPADIAACQANALDNALIDCGDRIVTASHDGGVTWTPEQPMDSPDYPNSMTGGFNAIPVAAFGYLATVYFASSAPGAQCPCVVFEFSRDDGRHWTRRVIPGAVPQAHGGVSGLQTTGPGELVIGDGQTTVFGPYPAADPSHPGRFAFLEPANDHTDLLLYETSDFGQTWVGPVHLGRRDGNVKERPWLAFSPHGALAAYWRTDYAADSTFDPWVSVARSGDIRDFEPPVRMSAHRAPISETSDDNSDAVIDDHYVYVTWGDSTKDNQTEAWIGRYQYQ